MAEKVSRASGSRAASEPRSDAPRLSRRDAFRYGAAGLVTTVGVGSVAYFSAEEAESEAAASVFKHDAPGGELWQRWQERGWAREARHVLTLGRNVQCKVCPHECLLAPDDRGRCRNKVNKSGKLYTLAYGNPCSFHIDPIEKKPLFHFLPATRVFSIATSGCSFRCLNCQNWEISQKTPEETKSAEGEALRLDSELGRRFSREDMARLSMPPEDVVRVAQSTGCRSIAYTYSEPTSFYEYMLDTARLARARGIKNVWVTNGYIQTSPLRELCEVLDGANVDLKGFSEECYATLNAGKLGPVLQTLQTLKERGVWFEVTNLVVPRHTDDLAMIERMCGWMMAQLGPDFPLHFSRFHPQFKLDHLPPTPVRVLQEAKRVAMRSGLRHIYLGNVRGVAGAATTLCSRCGEAVLERQGYHVRTNEVRNGRCGHCGEPVAGVWS